MGWLGKSHGGFLGAGFGGTPRALSAIVSGAGTAAANGTYTPRGSNNGRPYYNLVGQPDSLVAAALLWNGAGWFLFLLNGDNGYFNNNEDVAFPWLSFSWETIDGNAPAPTVSQG